MYQTSLFLLHFKNEKADYVIMETGLGGRLDATNVLNSLLCVITPISLEHTQILGDTLEAIAEEKAAIIKSDRQLVVVAQQEAGVLKVISNKSE